MGKKMLFIFNPRSGKGSIKNRLMDILDIFVKGGYEITVHPTQAYMDGLKVTKRKAGDYDIVVASGGDGTLDEVVTGMLIGGHQIRIGQEAPMILQTVCTYPKICCRRQQILWKECRMLLT